MPTCYLMVRDVGDKADEAGLEWGVDFGLKDGEELPADVETLSEAQFAVYRMMKVLQGTFEEMDAKMVMGAKPSGLVVQK